MSAGGSRLAVVEHLPCRPPLELIERDGVWVVREYHDSGEHPPGGVTRLGTHDRRMDAMRAGKQQMETRQHPCLLRWESVRNVGGLYWNSNFEQLSVRFSSLLGVWVVKTPRDDLALATGDSASEVVTVGRRLLEQYDFKRLTCYGKSGDEREQFEHRFVRNDVAGHGVRFNRGRIPRAAETPADDVEDGDTDDDPAVTTERSSPDEDTAVPTREATGVHSSLAATVPDVTELQPVDVDGVVHAYELPWEGTTARVMSLDPEHADEQWAVDGFATAVSDWLGMTAHENVGTVFESAADPATWIIYDAESPQLSQVAERLSGGEQMHVLSQLGDTVTAAQRQGIYRTGLSPETVRVTRDDSTRTQGTPVDTKLTGFGLRAQVAEAAGTESVSRFTPPESFDGGSPVSTTPVYRLGALAY
ncbi:MAG: hypothetical protein J07HB67_00945, partial [halophilic archaeon J07HB67]